MVPSGTRATGENNAEPDFGVGEWSLPQFAQYAKASKGSWMRTGRTYIKKCLGCRRAIKKCSQLCHKCQLDRNTVCGYVHNIVGAAVKAGVLPPIRTLQCEDCGKRAEAYDHRDYTEPLFVIAVCDPCNFARGLGIPYYLGGLAKALRNEKLKKRRRIFKIG